MTGIKNGFVKGGKNETLLVKFTDFIFQYTKRVLCGEVIDLQHVSRRALSAVNLFVSGDYVADSLLLFFSTVTMITSFDIFH